MTHHAPRHTSRDASKNIEKSNKYTCFFLHRWAHCLSRQQSSATYATPPRKRKTKPWSAKRKKEKPCSARLNAISLSVGHTANFFQLAVVISNAIRPIEERPQDVSQLRRSIPLLSPATPIAARTSPLNLSETEEQPRPSREIRIQWMEPFAKKITMKLITAKINKSSHELNHGEYPFSVLRPLARRSQTAGNLPSA